MIKSSFITFLFLSVFIHTVKAQFFWTESFNNGCASKCKANTYTGPNGAWKDTIMGTEGATPNEWFISYAEVGEEGGQCEDKSTQHNSCLHISSSSDIGAMYALGAACTTDRRIISPTINCNGKSNVTLQFDFICFGDTVTHTAHCDLEYSIDNGVNWTILRSNLVSDDCSPVAMWQTLTIPFNAAVNKPNVKLAFHWKNEGTSGFPPAIAVDSIRFSTINDLTTGPIPLSPFCPCSPIKVPFTSSGLVFVAGNNFTAQLSDATGSFAAPTAIGDLKNSTATSGSIDAVIPCNTPPGTNYKIRVISSNPAITGTETSITISPPLNVTVTPNPDTVCVGSWVTLKPSGATIYNWPVGTNPGKTADTVGFKVLKDTTVVVVGITGSCFKQENIVVRAQKPPKVTVTNDTTCTGLPAILIATGGGKYIWNTGSQNDTLFVPNQTKDTMYIVTVTTGHCTVKDTGYVKVYPTIKVSVNSPEICAGKRVMLQATGAISYEWSNGKKTDTIWVSPTTTTTYTVTGKAGPSCENTAVATVTVKPKPDVNVTTPASVCQGSSVFLHATGAKDYVWLGNGAVIKPPTGPDVEVIANFTTIVTVVGVNDGCIDSTDVKITIDQRPNVIVTNAVICQGGTATLTATGATKYYWPPPVDPSIDSLATVQVKGLMKDATITVYGFNGACKDTAFAFVTVGVPVPVVASGITEIYSCESTQLFANPTDGTYSWGTVGGGDGNIECPECPSTKVTPTSTTSYYVVYTSPKGCVGLDTIKVTVINTNSYFIPTGFSPNGDGINDVVQVHGRGIDHISLMIFDRVGEKVFETHEIENGWDGKLHGILMNDNVFVYKLEIYYCNGESLKETGNITMLK